MENGKISSEGTKFDVYITVYFWMLYHPCKYPSKAYIVQKITLKNGTMNQLLDFIGALLFAVVMVVIAPLLTVVYLFIAFWVLLRYCKKSVVFMFVRAVRFKKSLLQLDYKKYIFFYKSGAYK